jgi:hypothetical protein
MNRVLVVPWSIAAAYCAIRYTSYVITVPLQVMLPRLSVASTKPEAALVRSQGWIALVRARVGSGAA